MIVADGRITMGAGEWEEFRSATFAPWMPRTPMEFDAMCALGSARHLAENTAGQGFIYALIAEGMAFGPDGEVNFPMNEVKRAHMAIGGKWPADSEFMPCSEASAARAKLRRLK
jgi:hypothetical protein